jgi:two-component system, OmpR family, sensor histidine kinase KdpD
MAASDADRAAGAARTAGRPAARGSRPVWPTALALAAGLVVISTLLVALITPAVPVDAAGVFYLVAVLGVSTLLGLRWGLATSLASAVAYNFFFLPPRHTLVIDSSSDWLALAAFVATAVVTSNLAAREHREREEASRRAAEAGLGEALATLIATAPDLDSVLPALATQAAHAIGAQDGVIVRGAGSADPAGGLRLELADRTLGELRLSGCPPDALESPAAQRIARSLAGLMALGEERERRQNEQVHAAALARSNELKTALLRAVSHDLRSPLAAITTSAGGLRYAQLDAEERELVETISEQGARMSRMIENLLDLSRLQAGAVAPSADWVDARDLVEAALDELGAGEPPPRIRLTLDHDLPLVRADGSQLQRVVVNLIENALKFSPVEAPVRVSVSDRAQAVEVAVEDDGPGVAEADREQIFEAFYRGTPPRGAPGSGLGLAIAHGLAVANGCTLGVQRAGAGGARFVLAIPHAPDAGE